MSPLTRGDFFRLSGKWGEIYFQAAVMVTESYVCMITYKTWHGKSIALRSLRHNGNYVFPPSYGTPPSASVS